MQPVGKSIDENGLSVLQHGFHRGAVDLYGAQSQDEQERGKQGRPQDYVDGTATRPEMLHECGR